MVKLAEYIAATNKTKTRDFIFFMDNIFENLSFELETFFMFVLLIQFKKLVYIAIQFQIFIDLRFNL